MRVGLSGREARLCHAESCVRGAGGVSDVLACLSVRVSACPRSRPDLTVLCAAQCGLARASPWRACARQRVGVVCVEVCGH